MVVITMGDLDSFFPCLFFVVLVTVNTTSNGSAVKFFVMRDIHSVEMEFFDVDLIKNGETVAVRCSWLTMLNI